MRTLRFLSLTLLTLSLGGCGGGPNDSVTVAPVSGVVKLDGSPLPDAVITFYPEKGPTGIGMGDSSGAFIVKTNGQKGAPVGKCKVTVVAANQAGEVPEMDGNEAEYAKKTRLNAKYSSPETTDLIIDVTAEGNQNLQLDLDT
ncbi:MAG: hypothetical protein KDA81_19045 [Planctomycetaceae bacterium]|nr:hypothetical protein [Planctomycetaceae bacterium]